MSKRLSKRGNFWPFCQEVVPRSTGTEFYVKKCVPVFVTETTRFTLGLGFTFRIGAHKTQQRATTIILDHTLYLLYTLRTKEAAWEAAFHLLVDGGHRSCPQWSQARPRPRPPEEAKRERLGLPKFHKELGVLTDRSALLHPFFSSCTAPSSSCCASKITTQATGSPVPEINGSTVARWSDVLASF